MKTWKLSWIFSPLLIMACASSLPKTDLEKVFKRIPNDEYVQLISKHSYSDKRYEGFYNTYQVSATIINSRVQEALLQREGYFMQWEVLKAQNEREKAMQKMSSGSEFFVTLYTPVNGHNDLHKEASMWKVILESNGQRYKGDIKKFQKNLIQTQNLYPDHTRFNKAYTVIFNVPMSIIENENSVLILTSSLGTTTFKYLPK